MIQNTNDKMIRRGFRLTQIGVAGVWLIVLYPVLMWVVVGTLSSYGFQDKIKLFKDGKGNYLTTPAVIRLAEQLKAIEDRESALEKKLADEEAQLKSASMKLIQTIEQMTVSEGNFIKFEKEIVPRLGYLYIKNDRQLPAYFVIEEIGTDIEMYVDDPTILKLAPRYKEIVLEMTDAEAENIKAKKSKNMQKMRSREFVVL
jgi:hypothetical protein